MSRENASEPTPAPPPVPPGGWAPLLRLARLAGRPLEHFLEIEAASGIVLLLTAVGALLWANSPWADTYQALLATPVGFRVGDFAFERTLEWGVNDCLMVIFFFVVGMEIRRELHQGELSEWRRATLPVAAAVGGMLAPALLYLALAPGPETREGWGVPMATDIAFAVGVLTLLGKRVPAAMRVLLLALAVIDDLGAIIVIAVFYSEGLTWAGFLLAALGVALIFALQAIGVRRRPAYVVPGVLIWAGLYWAGVHPTLAGVIIGLLTPVRAWFGKSGFMQGVQAELGEMEKHPVDSSHELAERLRHIDNARQEALSPAEGLIESLHPWVAFFIMPVFALVNAGVRLEGLELTGPAAKVALGSAVGLVLGKPLGVLALSGLALALKVAKLPKGLTGRHLLVLGVTAGIGFTMSLFIAQLAFPEGALLVASKLGVLAASGGTAVVGLVLGWLLLKPVVPVLGVAQTADEAERSNAA